MRVVDTIEQIGHGRVPRRCSRRERRQRVGELDSGARGGDERGGDGRRRLSEEQRELHNGGDAHRRLHRRCEHSLNFFEEAQRHLLQTVRDGLHAQRKRLGVLGLCGGMWAARAQPGALCGGDEAGGKLERRHRRREQRKRRHHRRAQHGEVRVARRLGTGRRDDRHARDDRRDQQRRRLPRPPTPPEPAHVVVHACDLSEALLHCGAARLLCTHSGRVIEPAIDGTLLPRVGGAREPRLAKVPQPRDVPLPNRLSFHPLPPSIEVLVADERRRTVDELLLSPLLLSALAMQRSRVPVRATRTTRAARRWSSSGARRSGQRETCGSRACRSGWSGQL